VTVGVVGDLGVVSFVDEEQSESGGLMRRVVVSKLGNGKEVGPVVLLVIAVHPNVGLQRLIETFSSSVGLGVIARGTVKDKTVQVFSIFEKVGL
jgi:hypothetical protein